MSSRPPNRNKRRTVSRKYTSSFSAIDWGSYILSASFRPRKSSFNVSPETLDLPSMGETKRKSSSVTIDLADTELDGPKMLVEQALQELEESNNSRRWWWRRVVKEFNKPTKVREFNKPTNVNSFYKPTSKRASLEQANEDRPQLSGKRGDNNCKGDEDSLDASEGSSWLFVIMLLVVLVSAVACIITFGPNMAILPRRVDALKGKMNLVGALDETVQQQLIDQQQLQERGQKMLDVAEHITAACGDSSLVRNNIGGVMECLELCYGHMCCVGEEAYSCVDDASMECAVYAGCVALTEKKIW